MDFHNFFAICGFEIKESIADIPTEPPCLGGNDQRLIFLFVTFKQLELEIEKIHFVTFPRYHTKSCKSQPKNDVMTS